MGGCLRIPLELQTSWVARSRPPLFATRVWVGGEPACYNSGFELAQLCPEFLSVVCAQRWLAHRWSSGTLWAPSVGWRAGGRRALTGPGPARSDAKSMWTYDSCLPAASWV